MQKSTWIAVIALAVLAGVFFVIRDEPSKTVETPTRIEAVEKMSRVEIIQPKAAGGELIVFERGEAGWRMTRPVEGALTGSAQNKLEGLFAKEIRTDDLRLSVKKAKEYGLDEASAVKVAAYSAGSDTAALELEVGREVRVEQTDVRRTYIRKPGKDRIYRAQVALGDFVRNAPDKFRPKAKKAEHDVE
jgi:hypothetical protein